MALVSVYTVLCLFAFVGFLALAATAKLRPDLDEEGFDPAGLDLAELEKLKKLASLGDALSLEPLIMEEPFWSPPSRLARASSEGVRDSSTPVTSHDPAAADDFYIDPAGVATIAADLVKQVPPAWRLEVEARPFKEKQ